MTVLRQRMIEDMQLRGLAPRTQEAYVAAVEQLAKYYHKPPDEIGEDELRQYLLYLQNEKRVSASTMTVALCGIKFLYQHTLQREWHEDFLLPVRALSVLFRAKFRDALRKTELFADIPPEVWTQDWVVHCQPVGNGAGALKYLAPYIFRVAISNRRILSLDDGQVTFGYTDGRSGQRKTCTVTAEEFIRRFLQHVLPKGFSKVRYYGFYSPSRRETLSKVQQLLPGAATPAQSDQRSPAGSLPATEMQCPACGKPMRLVSTLRPRSRCPP